MFMFLGNQRVGSVERVLCAVRGSMQRSVEGLVNGSG